ncbi:DUF488 family protein [Leucobacter allii]|uniref:DUF488 domain-containing protein n=1 Tax=Leucobacter allii TaxID=2932247 RepID=UPI001FD16001|nr:DUF488 family protein [Leucobacter allii]UOR00364.1 DUF488 family protein [Leucobacter allii]
MDVVLKRIYEPASPDDGFRVLVDRLWPRGIAKADARLDAWAKDAAPSPGLRRAWHADPEGRSDAHFASFSADYRAELEQAPASEALDELVALARAHQRLTLLYGAKDPERNHAGVLREALLARLHRAG